MLRWVLPLAMLSCFLGMRPLLAAGDRPHWREPIALAWSADGRQIYTANQKNGAVSVIDAGGWKLVSESPVAERLADLAIVPGTGRLLALDDVAHQLLVLASGENGVTVSHRIGVAPYPVRVVISADSRSAVVSSLWSRTLSRFELPSDASQPPRLAQKLELSFPPRELLLVEDKQRLVVGDAFDGRLGVIDLNQFKLLHLREFPAHNIRGLARSVDGGKLIVAHQMLNELAQAIQGDVHWGLMMSNDLRWLRLEAVLSPPVVAAENPREELYRGAHMHPLGEPGRGGGDPAGLAVAKDGTVLVTLGGVNEVGIGKEDDFQMKRLGGKAAYSEEYGEEYEAKPGKKKAALPSYPEIGRRPTAVATSPDGKWAVVACTFEDLLAVIDVAARKVVRHVSLGPTPELTVTEQGSRLFYDARLSHDGWMSCHSCHTDGHTNNQRNDNLSDNGYGAPKRVLSLLAQQDTAPYAWSGATKTLADQVRNSTSKTMQGREPSEEQVTALVSFVQTLALPPPVARLQGKEDAAAIARGASVFAKRNCAQCHAEPTFTTPQAHDAGIQDELEVKLFNPPSLRGLSHRGPYFHDNRAATLEDVFLKHGHPRDSAFEIEEIADLVAYLRSL